MCRDQMSRTAESRLALARAWHHPFWSGPLSIRGSFNDDSVVGMIKRAYAMMQWATSSRNGQRPGIRRFFNLGVIQITVCDISYRFDLLWKFRVMPTFGPQGMAAANDARILPAGRCRSRSPPNKSCLHLGRRLCCSAFPSLGHHGGLIARWQGAACPQRASLRWLRPRS